MAGRSSRSPAGLHPSNSPASPRIEDLLNISMHPVPSPRAQRVSGAPNQPSARRSLYSPLSPAGHPSISSAHPDAALGSGISSSRISSIMATSPTNRRAASSNFVPRVVRGTISGRDNAASTSASSSQGTGVAGGGPAVPPTRTRRPSNSATATLSTPHRTVSAPPPLSTVVPPPSHVTSFPRPSYLDYSAMRYCIQSEPNPSSPPDMYRFDSLHTGVATARSRSRDASSSRDTDSDEESNTSAGERGHTLPPPRMAQRKPVPTYMHIPTRWSTGDRCPSLSVSVDGRDLTFHGPANGGDKEAAAARTNFPIPAACGIYYYEIEILNKGVKGHIAIGFGTDAVKLSRLPGWEDHSWGYHGDDGNSFASERTGTMYGPKFTTQDVVGCGLDFSTGQAFFTKNGRYLGPVFDNLASVGELYPTVGLRTPGEAIRANFGHEPFKFNIDSHVEHMRNVTWANIQNTPVTWSLSNDIGTFNIPGSGTNALSESADVSRPLNDLILGYLTHHGYAKTARAFKTQRDRRNGILTEQNDTHDYAMTTELEESTSNSALDASIISTGSNSSLDSAIIQGDTLKRQKIVRSIIFGDIDTALDETKTHFPTVLDRNGGMILFKLRCRKFVELVLEAAAAWRKVREAEVRGKGKDFLGNGTSIQDGSELMDVDEESGFNGSVTNGAASSAKVKVKATFLPALTSKPPSQIALEHALANGQSLQADYKSDARPEVQAIYKKALSLVAYDDPLADDPRVPEPVKEMAGQGARDQLAEEVNRAILESQGRPPHAALERLYRQTQACIMQLGWMGVGSAAFADMPKEFLDA